MRFCELIATRFSHDITGPIGAVNNGIELIEDDPEMAAGAVDLMALSVRELMSRLKFFRQCYGTTANEGFADIQNLQEIVNNFLNSTKVNINWYIEDRHISHKAGKIMLNMIFVAYEALIKGGTIDLFIRREGNNPVIRVEAIGDKIILDEGVEASLGGSVPNFAPKIVPAYVIKLFVEEMNYQVKHTKTDTNLSIEMRC